MRLSWVVLVNQSSSRILAGWSMSHKSYSAMHGTPKARNENPCRPRIIDRARMCRIGECAFVEQIIPPNDGAQKEMNILPPSSLSRLGIVVVVVVSWDGLVFRVSVYVFVLELGDIDIDCAAVCAKKSVTHNTREETLCMGTFSARQRLLLIWIGIYSQHRTCGELLWCGDR